MKKKIVIAVMLLAGHAAAASLVAMRVDTAPGGFQDGLGVVELMIQVAPEDRARLGNAVWIAGELQRGDEVVQRLDERSRMDADGAIRTRLLVPPGSYQLRVDIEGLGTGATGFWKGRLSVPDLPPAAPQAAGDAATPEIADAPAPPPPLTSSTSDAVEAAASPTSADETTGVDAGEVAAEESVAAADDTAVAMSAVAAGAASAPAPAAEPEKAATKPAPPEPAPAATPPPAPAVKPAPAPPAAIEPGLAVVTVLVTDAQNTPLSGLGRDDFTVQVNGNAVAVEGFASSRSPLRLGLAVDLSSTMADLLPELRTLVAQIAERQLATGGDCVLVTAAEHIAVAVPPGSPPGSVMAALATTSDAESHDLAALVQRALKELEGSRGRAALFLLSDGGDTASKADWKAAREAAATAGVPVLVCIFDGSELGARTLGRLRKIAAVSGGKDYLLQGTPVLRLTLDHFEELIQSSVALAFAAPGGRVSRLKITTQSGATVLHSEAVTGP